MTRAGATPTLQRGAFAGNLGRHVVAPHVRLGLPASCRVVVPCGFGRGRRRRAVGRRPPRVCRLGGGVPTVAHEPSFRREPLPAGRAAHATLCRLQPAVGRLLCFKPDGGLGGRDALGGRRPSRGRVPGSCNAVLHESWRARHDVRAAVPQWPATAGAEGRRAHVPSVRPTRSTSPGCRGVRPCRLPRGRPLVGGGAGMAQRQRPDAGLRDHQARLCHGVPRRLCGPRPKRRRGAGHLDAPQAGQPQPSLPMPWQSRGGRHRRPLRAPCRGPHQVRRRL